MTAAPASLSADTETKRVDKVPGLHVARLPEHWNYLNPSGGALLTVALRAMIDELDAPELALLSATTLFCAPIHAGALEIEVKVLRRGESAAQVRARLAARAQPGPGLEVIATFAKARPGPDVHGVRMPDVPPPEQCALADGKVFDPKDYPFPFYRNVDVAQAIGEPMIRPGWQAGPAHVAYWYRYRVPQRTPSGHFDPLAIPPIADTMPGALARKLGPEHPRFLAPSLDLTVYFFGPTTSEWILVESFAERALGGYAVCSANLWDPGGALVARATQSMTLREMKARSVRADG
jgi:acyl-CoA thioesterase